MADFFKLPTVFPFGNKSDEAKLFVPLEQSIGYLTRKQRARIRSAYSLAYKAHFGQLRIDGEPYISHPVAVAQLLADLKLDADTVIAGLLHDVIEDTDYNRDSIAEHFGLRVAEVVDGVSKLERLDFSTHSEAQRASLQKMILAMAADLRVLLVKLADRVHNARSLNVFNLKKRYRIGRETLDIYAPLAARIGINGWRLELEDNGFEAIKPWRSRILKKSIKKAKGERQKTIEEVTRFIRQQLKASGIAAKVEGREKQAYSLYRKMDHRKIQFEQVLDLFAYRIIVKRADECYRALGLIHSLYKPVPGRFKDYIALPKPNGYQSLHTIIFGPSGVHVEIQIRTRAMHVNAESGLAAHWNYKEKGSDTINSQQSLLSLDWVNNLAEIGEFAGNSTEFIDTLKTDLFPQEIYVFTPKGKVQVLPRQSTAIDFAYAIHTDLGNRCVGCEVNRNQYSLSQPLENGQTVNIITSNFGRPSPQWLNFVVTAKARTQVRSYLKTQRTIEAKELGEQLLIQALNALSIDLSGVSNKDMQAFLKKIGVKDLTHLYYQLGVGDRPAQLIANQLHEQLLPMIIPENPKNETKPLLIKGTEGVMVTFGQCCYPIVGDAIMGRLGIGKGIVIHRLNCHNVQKYKKETDKWINVDWHNTEHEQLPVSIVIENYNRPGSFAKITTVLHQLNIDIDSINSQKGADTDRTVIIMKVTNRKHLAEAMRRIRSLPYAITVART